MGSASSVEGENCCSVQLRNQARPGECEEALPIWLTEGEIFPECETFRQGIECLRSQAAPEPGGSEALAVETLPASHAQLPKEACGSSTDASSKSPDQVLVPDDPVNGTSGELPTVAANAEAKSSSEQEPTLREDEKVPSKEEEPLLSLRNLLPYWQAWGDFAQAEKTARHAALQTLLRDSFCGWHDFAATEKAARHADMQRLLLHGLDTWHANVRLLLRCLHAWRDFAKAEKAERVVKGEKLTEAPPQPPLETEVEETPPEDPSSCLQEMLEGISRTNRAYWKELQLPAEQIILNEVQKIRPRRLDPKIMKEVKRALRNLEGALEDCATSEDMAVIMESELEIHKKIIQEIENDYVDTLNTKTDLAVLLQQLDKKEEAEQKLREVLTTMQAKNDKLDSQTIGGSSTSERVKENFALHFVMNGQASVIDKTGDIAFEGNIRREATFCIISFPGKFASGWDALVAALHGESVACVFLTTPETGLGKHKDDGSGKCWCSQIYGERNFKQFGYLVEMKDPDPEKLKQALENAKCTHAIVVPFHATPEERKAYEEEAKKAWEKYGKVASWGCEWFVVWMEQVKQAVQLGQRLQVVFFPGQRGQGKVAWDELSFRDLWDGVGCGGSQKAEIAYVEAMRKIEGDTWDYDEIDVKRFLFQEFHPNCKVFAEDPTDGSWREGTMVLTMPDSQSSETLSRV
ncbi:Uncharacterized protein SCF082_LOCUS10180 [Durusdinium trenchii]|uniref:Uncharacterized protein n=1 Tax=Durusdinium trenchii TaxID=1381693 RepID=A0ABP0J461_9DINO